MMLLTCQCVVPRVIFMIGCLVHELLHLPRFVADFAFCRGHDSLSCTRGICSKERFKTSIVRSLGFAGLFFSLNFTDTED